MNYITLKECEICNCQDGIKGRKPKIVACIKENHGIFYRCIKHYNANFDVEFTEL